MKVKPQFALYVHIPWCYKKCPYCDFNAYDLNVHKTNFEDYYRFLEYELIRLQAHYPFKREVSSIYFGGGTPSLSPPHLVRRLLEKVKSHFILKENCEISMEVSPRTPLKNIRQFKLSGVNRFSIGIQSFQDSVLSSLGREHTSSMIKPMLETIHSFDDVQTNIDVIYGLAEQSQDSMLSDLRCAIETGTNHISWYELTIEPNTLFAKSKKEKASPALIEDVYFAGKELLSSAGLQQYEISAFTRSRPCQHNRSYWKFEDYIGIGAGAHSKVTINPYDLKRFYVTRYPKDYLRFPKLKVDSVYEPALDYLISRLRLYEIVTTDEIKEAIPKESAFFLIKWLESYTQRQPTLMSATSRGFELTEKAYDVLNDIIYDYQTYTGS